MSSDKNHSVLSDLEPQMANGYEWGQMLRDTRTRYQFRAGENASPARGAFEMETRMSGGAPRAEVIVRRDVPPADVAVLLDTLEPVVVRDRRLYRDDRLVQLAVSYIPGYVAEAAPQVAEQDSGRGGIKSRMQEAGLPQYAAVEDVTLEPATPEQADAFGVSEGWPLVTITHKARVADGRLVEVTIHTHAPGWTLRYEVPLA